MKNETPNAKREAGNAECGMRNAKRAAIAVMALLMAVPVFGDLPGLPVAEGVAESKDARPGGERREGGETVHAVVAAPTGPVRGSLFKQGAVATPMSADGQPLIGSGGPAVSFMSVAVPQARKYHKNDILTVIIREDSDSTTNSTGNSKKTQDFDLALQQFLQLALSQSGLPTVGTVNTPSKLPEIKFKYSNDRQATADQARTDSFSARISATVVDVKPNGTMVIEAVKQIVVDKEEQVFKLTGNCRVEDIAVDNTILSTQLASLSLSKQTKGEVRDGVKRGWLNQFIDKFNPF